MEKNCNLKFLNACWILTKQKEHKSAKSNQYRKEYIVKKDNIIFNIENITLLKERTNFALYFILYENYKEHFKQKFCNMPISFELCWSINVLWNNWL